MIKSAKFSSIVFVHGLGGHAQGTWTYRGPKRDPVSCESQEEIIGRPFISELQGEDITGSSIERDQVRGRSEAQIPLEEQVNQAQTVWGSFLSRPKITIPRLSPPFSRSRGKLKEQTQPQRADVKRDAATNKKCPHQDSARNVAAENNTFFWPQNLPEVCARARVMTFGYDSDVTKFFGGAANQNTFYDHAGDLLGALVRKRTDAVCTMTSHYSSTNLQVETAR